MDAAHVLFGKPVQRLAREGGAEAVDRHGGALAALPAGGFERQERFGREPDLVGGARHDMLELALVGEAPLQPAELAEVVRLQRLLQIGVAVELAFQERAARPRLW